MTRQRQTPALSAEAAALLADGSGRWELVELGDGPAAQALVAGVKARPAPVTRDTLDLEDERPADHPDMFDGEPDG